MVRAGSGDPKHAARNQKERERYHIVSNTIEELKKKLKLSARCHTEILAQTLENLRKLKAENHAKVAEKGKIMTEIELSPFVQFPQPRISQFPPSSLFPVLQNQPAGRILPNIGNSYGHFPYPYGNSMCFTPQFTNKNSGIPFYQPQLPPQFTQQLNPS